MIEHAAASLMERGSIHNANDLRLLAGRAIHRPTDLKMQEVVTLATAIIAFLEPSEDKAAANGTRRT